MKRRLMCLEVGICWRNTKEYCW